MATRSQNRYNCKVKKTSQSGIKGVLKIPDGTWKVNHPTVQKSWRFSVLEEATAVRCLLEDKCQGDFSHRNSRAHSRSPPPSQNIFETFERIEKNDRHAPHKNNTSGVRGVTLEKGSNRWVAHILVQGKRHSERHDNVKQAIAARCLAEHQAKTNQINQN